MTSFLRKYWLLLLLFGIMIIVFGFGDHFSLYQKQFFFTLSSLIKTFLLVGLPFLIFPFIVMSIANLQGKGAVLVIAILFGVALSQFIAILFGYGIGELFFPLLDLGTHLNLGERNDVCVLIDWEVDPFFTIEISLLCGLITGIILSYTKQNIVHRAIGKYLVFSTFFFEKIFTPLLPLYIFGFLLKLQNDTDCGNIFEKFRTLIVLLFMAQILYIFFYFLWGKAFKSKPTFKAFRRALPAGVTAFSSISSVITLPVTLKAAEENVQDKTIANLTIPTTVNCHALGDAIALPLIALAIYYMSYASLPDFWTYLPFALMLTLAQFGAISVAGGSVIIIVPILISHLKFSPEMIGLITAVSIFLDPWNTGWNVMGNSGYVMIVDRIYRRFRRARPLSK